MRFFKISAYPPPPCLNETKNERLVFCNDPLTVKPKAKGQKAEDAQRFYGRTPLPQDTANLSMLVVQMFPLNIFQRYTKAARQRNGRTISCIPKIVIPKTLTSYIHDPTNRPFICFLM